MIKTSDKVCKTCKYGKTLMGFGYGCQHYCDYYIMTQNSRGCKVGECDKYEPKKGGKECPKITN